MPISSSRVTVPGVPGIRRRTFTPTTTSTSSIPTTDRSRKILSSQIPDKKKELPPPPKLSKKERKREKWLKIKESKATSQVLTASRKYYGNWAETPDLVLEIIFQYLSLRDKLCCARVCYQWFSVLRCRSVWQNFIVNDNFMTRPRLNYAGNFYEEVLDHNRASSAINKLIPKSKRLLFLPKNNLPVCCGFQTMLIRWCGYYGDLENIHSFTYVFPCDFARKSNEVDIYGTGGTILAEMKGLLLHLTGLKRLELLDLELEEVDAMHVLDEVSSVCDVRITTLKMINISRHPFEMLAVATFVNLKNLYISPHNIGPDLVMCFGDMQKLRNIILVVNAFTDCVCAPVDPRIWKLCRKNNPNLRIHLLSEGKRTKKEVVFQEGAPVKSIVYDSSYAKTSAFSIYAAVDMYKTDLECIAYCRLPKYHMPRSFHDRGDGPFLHLIKQCPYIHTLMVRERISSATVLLLAFHGKNLRYFYVRRNAVVLKCDWPKNPSWDDAFYQWLKASSRSYEKMEKEVSTILGFRWYSLNDKQFKLTNINLTAAYYFDGYEDLTSN